MSFGLRGLGLAFGTVLVAGCAIGKSESFTFTTDMPPDFTYGALAQYVPAKGETCTVEKPNVGYNQRWRLGDREQYKRDLQIPLYRTVNGCRLVIYRLELRLYRNYGAKYGDFSAHSAAVAIRERFQENIQGTFDSSGVSVFTGECEVMFRTMGKPRVLRQLLNCRPVDAQGVVGKGRPIGPYILDQLPGKTVKLKIKLAAEERPGWRDTWVKVPGGWKRCLGEGYEDPHAYCNGNYKDFSSFLMPDGRRCTIYPGCTE